MDVNILALQLLSVAKTSGKRSCPTEWSDGRRGKHVKNMGAPKI